MRKDWTGEERISSRHKMFSLCRIEHDLIFFCVDILGRFVMVRV